MGLFCGCCSADSFGDNAKAMNGDMSALHPDLYNDDPRIEGDSNSILPSCPLGDHDEAKKATDAKTQCLEDSLIVQTRLVEERDELICQKDQKIAELNRQLLLLSRRMREAEDKRTSSEAVCEGERKLLALQEAKVASLEAQSRLKTERIDDFLAKQQELSATSDELSTKFAESVAQCSHLQDQLSEALRENREIEARAIELELALQETTNQSGELKIEMREKVSALEKENRDLNSSLTQSSSEIENLKAILERNEKRTSDVEDSLRNELKEQLSRLEELSLSESELKTARNQLQSQNEDLDAKTAELHSEIVVRDSMIAEFEATKARDHEELQQLRSEIRDSEHRAEIAESELRTSENAAAALRDRVASQEKTENGLVLSLSSKEANIEELLSQKTQLSVEIRRMRENHNERKKKMVLLQAEFSEAKLNHETTEQKLQHECAILRSELETGKGLLKERADSIGEEIAASFGSEDIAEHLTESEHRLTALRSRVEQLLLMNKKNEVAEVEEEGISEEEGEVEEEQQESPPKPQMSSFQRKLLEATKKLSHLRKKELDEIRSYRQPPAGVHEIVRAVLALLGKSPEDLATWPATRRHLTRRFQQEVRNYRPNHRTKVASIKRLLRRVNREEAFQRSHAVGIMYTFLESIVGVVEEMSKIKHVESKLMRWSSGALFHVDDNEPETSTDDAES